MAASATVLPSSEKDSDDGEQPRDALVENVHTGVTGAALDEAKPVTTQARPKSG